MAIYRVSRRSLTASATVLAAGVFAASRPGQLSLAQDATPLADVRSTGFVSMRVRTVGDASQRDVVDEMVPESFAPDVEALEGFQGFLLGDVIDAPEKSLSILVLEDESQSAAFDDLAKEFVQSIADDVETVETVQWSGDLLITGGPVPDTSTPSATPAAGATAPGYVAVRIHTSLPGTDPRDFVPLATDGFLPIVAGLEGFRGYLWFPVEGGFAAITLYDSVESAEASNDAAREWAAEFLPAYTDGNPEVINAHVVYANLPILAHSGSQDG